MTNPPPDPQPALDPLEVATQRLAAMSTIVKALIARSGVPEATSPPSVSMTLTQSELANAQHTSLTIEEHTANDIQPENFIVVSAVGI